MLRVLHRIEILDKYTVREIQPRSTSRALISQTLTTCIETNQSGEDSIREIEAYLLSTGWEVKKIKAITGTHSLSAKKDRYIAVVETAKNDSYNPVVVIKYDDTLTRLNL